MNICVECEHHFVSNDQAHLKPAEHLCRASVAKDHPEWTNPVTGETYPAFKIYAECEHVNFDGKCRIFQQKPPESLVEEKRSSPSPLLFIFATILVAYFLGFLYRC